MSEVKPGDVLAGKFRIERVLGEGGMGIVVAAHHLQLDERVALKFLLPEALANGEAVARFAREARAAVKIKSEHVARVSDVGTLDTGAPYMVMEYLEGRDLSARVREGGALAVPEAVDYLLQACEAIAEAHALGIVHRDLKPANLFLTRRADGTPCVKVLDFGISKVTNPGSSSSDLGMTRTQAVMGSPLYMSPEQMASSRQVDGRTDIWALGVILYELLTGCAPFNAETMPQLCAMILQEQPPPLRELRADVPDAIVHVIARCLEKDRSQRFQNVAELAYALTPFGSPLSARSAERISRVLSAAGISSSTLDLHTGTAVASATTQSAWGEQSAVATRSKLPLVLSLAALSLVGVAGVVAFAVLRGGAQPELAASAAPQSTPLPPAPEPALSVVALPAPALEPVPAPPSVAPVPPAGSEAPAASSAPVKATAPAPRPRPAPRAPAPQPAAAAATPVKKPALDPLEGRR